MKTTTDFFDHLNSSNAPLFVSFSLVDAAGTSYDITERVRDFSDLDESVEDENLNIGGGDLVVVLDNRDRYFVGDHQGGGLFDNITWGAWQLFVTRGFQKATDELGAFRGIVSPAFERVDNGFRVKIVALSFASYAKKIDAWDGTDAGRLLFNRPIVDFVDNVLTQLDPNGIAPGESGSILDTDVQLPTLPGSGKFFQAFDSLIEPEGLAEEALARGPRRLYWMATDGDEEFFWLDTPGGVNDSSWVVAYDKTTKLWRVHQWFAWTSDSHGVGRPLFEGLADDFSSAKRYWFAFANTIETWTVDGSENLVSTTIRHEHQYNHSHGNPMVFTTSTDGSKLYYVEWESRALTTAHFRAYEVDRASGTRTLLVKVAVSQDPGAIQTGYRYLGEDGLALLPHAACVHPGGDQVLVFTGNSVFSHMITANTTVRKTAPSHPGDNRGYQIEDNDNEQLFFSKIEFFRAGDWCGCLAWRYGELDTPYHAYPPRGMMVDNYGGHPSYVEWVERSAWARGFGPEDDIGLLPADHPDNPTDEDERLNVFEEMRIDLHLTSSNRTRFSCLFSAQGIGLGHRSYTLFEPQSSPHVSGDKPFVSQDYRTALVSSEFDFAEDERGTCGERLDGLSGLPAEFFIQTIAQGPGGTPVNENRRITYLIRTAETIPVIHRAEMADLKVWEALTRALEAGNASGAFRWDESSSKLVFYVRGRTRVGAHQIIDEEFDFDIGGTERLWEHVYDGVRITAGLGQVGEAGDITSPNTRVLHRDNNFISPSLVEALASDFLDFFGQKRRVFNLTLRDRPHWEALDFLRVYLLNDRGNYRGRIMSRKVEFDTNRLRLLLVEG